MMRIIYFMLAISANAIMFGNPIENTGHAINGNHYRTTFLLDNISLVAGMVSKFHIATVIPLQPIRLQIWRRHQKDNHYTLVGQVIHVSGTQSKDEILLDSKLLAQDGDILGFTTETSLCPIPYTTDPFQYKVKSKQFVSELPVVGQEYDFAPKYYAYRFSISVEIEPVNQCSKYNGGCSHLCSESTNGYEITCSCYKGYFLSINQQTCYDVDECQSSPCTNDKSVCINTPGSFLCTADVKHTAAGDSSTEEEESGVLMWYDNPGAIVTVACIFAINCIVCVICILFCCCCPVKQKDSEVGTTHVSSISMIDIVPSFPSAMESFGEISELSRQHLADFAVYESHGPPPPYASHDPGNYSDMDATLDLDINANLKQGVRVGNVSNGESSV